MLHFPLSTQSPAWHVLGRMVWGDAAHHVVIPLVRSGEMVSASGGTHCAHMLCAASLLLGMSGDGRGTVLGSWHCPWILWPMGPPALGAAARGAVNLVPGFGLCWAAWCGGVSDMGACLPPGKSQAGGVEPSSSPVLSKA